MRKRSDTALQTAVEIAAAYEDSALFRVGGGLLMARESLSGSASAIRRNGTHSEPLALMQEKSGADSVSFAEVWEQMAGHTAPSLYLPGVQILGQGSCSSDVYLIRRGLIKLQSIDRAGRETIVGVRRTGSLVGAEAAIMRKPHLASAVTVTECCLQRFPTRQFCELIRTYPDLSWHLHQMNASELRETTAALVEVKSHTANIRLKRLVLELVPELNGAGSPNTEVRLPFKQWEIAQMLGVTPEHLSRLLRRLEKEGFLGRKGTILITRIPWKVRS
jgi:CRP/FNR family transcriptional regulator